MLKSFLHYRLIEKLGEGGMGMVFQARDTTLKRTVALKFLSHRISGNTLEYSRFRQEAQSAAALNHPNITQVYAFEELDGELCIVMEYVQSQELKECIEKGNLTLDQKCSIAEQIARALKAAHDKGIIHRDIKSRNIMIDEDGNVKVMDFGLARIQGEAHITKTGTTLGTTPYMAPEQFVGEEMDAQSDIWAYGVVLYELFTGQLPFQGIYEPAIIYAITEEEPVPVLELNPETPQRIAEVIEQSLVKNKELRYQSVDAILADLTTSKELKPKVTTGTENRGSRKTGRTLFKIGIPALLLVALLIYLNDWHLLWTNSNSPPKRYIAVMPIDNIGGNPAMQAICDGLGEIFSFKLSQLEKYEQSYWVAPASEMRMEKVNSVRRANKLFGVNLAIISSIQTVGDSTRLIVQLVDADNVRQLDTRQVIVSAQNYVSLEQHGVEAVLNMLNIEFNPNIAQTLQAGGPSDPKAYKYYLKGRANLQNYSISDSLDNAITNFQRSISIDPKFPLAYAGLGEAYWRKYESGRDILWVQKAKKALETSSELNNRLAPVQSLLGLVSAGTGDYKSAIGHYNSALGIDPNYTSAYRGLANAYDEQGNDEKAVATYKYAISLNPNVWEGYSDLGKHYIKKGNFEDAVRQFKKVIELNPESSTAYSNLGVGYHLQGKYEQATQAYQMALAIEKNPVAASNLAGIYFIDGLYDQAVQMYEIALETYSNRYTIWGNLAAAYDFSGKKEKAHQAYLKAIEKAREQLSINPNAPEVVADLGAYYSDTGDSSTALSYIKKALSLDDENIMVRQRAVSTYEKLGMRTKALKWINASMLSDIEVQPELAALVNDPRYADLKKKLEKSSQHELNH